MEQEYIESLNKILNIKYKATPIPFDGMWFIGEVLNDDYGEEMIYVDTINGIRFENPFDAYFYLLENYKDKAII